MYTYSQKAGTRIRDKHIQNLPPTPHWQRRELLGWGGRQSLEKVSQKRAIRIWPWSIRIVLDNSLHRQPYDVRIRTERTPRSPGPEPLPMWWLFPRAAQVGEALTNAHTSCHGVDILELANHLLLDI